MAQHPFEALFTARPRQTAISRIGQIARLREFAERLRQPCPFAVGQLVTPIAGRGVDGVGEPHLVLAVVEPFDRAGGARGDTPSYGETRDFKLASVYEGRETQVYAWSGDYEPYTGDGAEP